MFISCLKLVYKKKNLSDIRNLEKDFKWVFGKIEELIF